MTDDSSAKTEHPLHDVFLSDIENVRTMPFFGVVPDLEKYADIPALKEAVSSPVAQQIRQRKISSVIHKLKNFLS